MPTRRRLAGLLQTARRWHLGCREAGGRLPGERRTGERRTGWVRGGGVWTGGVRAGRRLSGLGAGLGLRPRLRRGAGRREAGLRLSRLQAGLTGGAELVRSGIGRGSRSGMAGARRGLARLAGRGRDTRLPGARYPMACRCRGARRYTESRRDRSRRRLELLSRRPGEAGRVQGTVLLVESRRPGE
jgi:hypothetical protein